MLVKIVIVFCIGVIFSSNVLCSCLCRSRGIEPCSRPKLLVRPANFRWQPRDHHKLVKPCSLCLKPKLNTIGQCSCALKTVKPAYTPNVCQCHRPINVGETLENAYDIFRKCFITTVSGLRYLFCPDCKNEAKNKNDNEKKNNCNPKYYVIRNKPNHCNCKNCRCFRDTPNVYNQFPEPKPKPTPMDGSIDSVSAAIARRLAKQYGNVVLETKLQYGPWSEPTDQPTSKNVPDIAEEKLYGLSKEVIEIKPIVRKHDRFSSCSCEESSEETEESPTLSYKDFGFGESKLMDCKFTVVKSSPNIKPTCSCNNHNKFYQWQ